MKLIKCEEKRIPAVMDFYNEVVSYLQSHINYPLWDSDRPSEDGIITAAAQGELYICIDDKEDILGAVVLSEDPEGDYDAGDWNESLRSGEYLCVHLLAVKPGSLKSGVGSFIMEECISLAQRGGYRALRLDLVPGNTPAERLYIKSGFTYAGTKDLKRNKVNIPLFDLYELNFN